MLMSVAALSLAVAGCTSKPAQQAQRHGKNAGPAVVVNPATNTKNVPVSAEIGATVSGGKITDVSLTDDKGGKVPGAMLPDGSSWMPNKALGYKRAYTAQVTATSKAGRTSTETSNFTTMAKPDSQVKTMVNVHNGDTYGVAMPVTVQFEPGVPKEDRAEVQRRLFVTTDPPQPGVWHWDADGKQVYYRAPDFWKPGTKVSLRSALAGVPIGKSFGDADQSGAAKIGDPVFLDIDNKTKTMSVMQDGKLAKKIPVSMGKSDTPTSAGKMVIMEKFDSTVFDTTGSADPYVVTVYDAQRLTWGGEFIHSAPWSVGEQGYMNVSHGCTNVSPEDAAYLMKVTHVGDLVTIKGTETHLTQGNGWTAWDLTWDQYVKGSALPVPASLQQAPTNPGR
jgi:lipoprotein-anchoring transpeptidase ErfK/SrfK